MLSFDDIKLKIWEWLSVSSNLNQLKKLLTKIAFFLLIATYFLTSELSEFLFWLAILILLFLTYLNYKFK